MRDFHRPVGTPSVRARPGGRRYEESRSRYVEARGGSPSQRSPERSRQPAAHGGVGAVGFPTFRRMGILAATRQPIDRIFNAGLAAAARGVTMTAEEFRSLALSLPETAEGAHMGHPDFRVGGRIFATLGPGEAWSMVKLT